jgi:hypothetical protein
MPLSFPSSPAVGDYYTPGPPGSRVWRWNGILWEIVQPVQFAKVGNRVETITPNREGHIRLLDGPVPIILAFLLSAVCAFGQATVSKVMVDVKMSNGKFQEVELTPVSNYVIGFDGTGQLVVKADGGGGSGTNTGDVTLTGTPDYITISGQTITRHAIDLAADVTGTLPAANGGTGITSLGTGVATALGQPVTGSGSIVLGNSPTISAPTLTISTNDAFVAGTGTASGLTAGEATAALGLKTATTTVSVSGATAPTSGQVLTATSSTAATWQTPSGGGGGLTNITETLHTASPNNTVNAEQLAVTGGTTNTDLVVTPRGTGAFIVGPHPDGTATGGNKRGTGAIHLQTWNNEAGKVASGAYSVVAGALNTASNSYAVAMGFNCTASNQFGFSAGQSNNVSAYNGGSIGEGNTVSGNWAFAFGRNNNLSGTECFAGGQTNTVAANFSAALGQNNQTVSGATHSIATGEQARADRLGMHAQASGMFAANGDAQAIRSVLRNKTTTNSAVTLFTNGSSTRLTIPSGKILHAQVTLLGSKSDGTAVASYMRQVAIKNVAGTTSLVGTVNTIGTDEAAGTSIAITADDTNDALQINVTGITSETWRWVAVVEGVELAFGN